MKITKAEEYGLRLVMSLAVDGGQLSIRELAERERLPETTVAKVIARLRKAGVVEAERGRNGGYQLATEPTDLTLARVVEAFDDKMFDSGFCDRMTPGEGPCARADRCTLRPVWRSLSEVVASFLDGITVADLLRTSDGEPSAPATIDSAASFGTRAGGPPLYEETATL